MIDETSKKAACRLLETVEELLPEDAGDGTALLWGTWSHPELDAQTFFTVTRKCGQSEMIARVALAVAYVVVQTAVRESELEEVRQDAVRELAHTLGRALAAALMMHLESTVDWLKKTHTSAEKAALDSAVEAAAAGLFKDAD